jgi:hypothetical protein
VGSADDHNLFDFVFVYFVDNLVESFSLQEFVREHYSVSVELHAGEPVEKLRM